MSFFNFLSAIDWMPSPFGREMDAAIDNLDDEVSVETEMEWGITGGEKRFQLLARVHNPVTNLGVNVKADLEGDFPEVETWTPVYPGANWHEREVMEMFGISFKNHPNMVNLYLPTEFEGHPLRKDFPLTGHVEVRYDDAQRRVVNEPVHLVQEFRDFDFLSPWEGLQNELGDFDAPQDAEKQAK